MVIPDKYFDYLCGYYRKGKDAFVLWADEEDSDSDVFCKVIKNRTLIDMFIRYRYDLRHPDK